MLMTSAKELFEKISGEGYSTRDLTNDELVILADYVISEGFKYEELPDSLKFKTAFAAICRHRGVILPDIVMYYCFN
jgi:hypothetical protein